MRAHSQQMQMQINSTWFGLRTGSHFFVLYTGVGRICTNRPKSPNVWSKPLFAYGLIPEKTKNNVKCRRISAHDQPHTLLAHTLVSSFSSSNSQLFSFSRLVPSEQTLSQKKKSHIKKVLNTLPDKQTIPTYQLPYMINRIRSFPLFTV